MVKSRRITRKKRSSPASSRELKLYSRVYNRLSRKMGTTRRKTSRKTSRKSRKSRRKTRGVRKLSAYQKFVREEFAKMKDSPLSAIEKMKLVSQRWKH